LDPTRDERFEVLFRENYLPVRRYALRRTSREATNDVVADTFLVAWRRLDDVPSDALPWLIAVARRVLANQRRSAVRGAALEQRVATAEGHERASDPAESVAEAELLRLALARLSDREREALMLVAWDGLPGRARPAPRAARAPRSLCAFTAPAPGSQASWPRSTPWPPQPGRTRWR
jgi:RNA polymerase sigma-70 factor (ECF subfamily)